MRWYGEKIDNTPQGEYSCVVRISRCSAVCLLQLGTLVISRGNKGGHIGLHFHQQSTHHVIIFGPHLQKRTSFLLAANTPSLQFQHNYKGNDLSNNTGLPHPCWGIRKVCSISSGVLSAGHGSCQCIALHTERATRVPMMSLATILHPRLSRPLMSRKLAAFGGVVRFLRAKQSITGVRAEDIPGGGQRAASCQGS